MKKFRMTIEYPDGQVINAGGERDLRHIITDLGLDKLDLKQSSVLDIATNEGYFAFWAEKQKAKNIVAIDIDDFGRYDWGWHRDEKMIAEHNAKYRDNEGKAVFDYHHKQIGSRVKHFDNSIYELDPKIHGIFDLIFNFGLLYHLRHPLLSMDACRKVSTDKAIMVLETHINNKYGSDVPLTQFYATTECHSVTDWCGPSTAAVTHMMRDAGFEYVFMTKMHYPAQYRQIFIGCVDFKQATLFLNNTNLIFCNKEYWDSCFEKSRIWKNKKWLLENNNKKHSLIKRIFRAIFHFGRIKNC